MFHEDSKYDSEMSGFRGSQRAGNPLVKFKVTCGYKRKT